MTMLNVLIASHGLVPRFGGSAASEAALAVHAGKHCRVRVLCRPELIDSAFARAEGLAAVTGVSPWAVVRALADRRHWLNDWFASTDVLHVNGHWRWETYGLCRLAKRWRVPYVLHPRGMLVTGTRKRALKRLFNLLLGGYVIRHAARIIALSAFEVRQFQAHGIRPARVRIIPDGITPPPPAAPAAAAAEPSFLYLGRIEARKNLVFLVEAFARYRAGGGGGRLVLVGPVERRYDRAVLAAAERLGVAALVELRPPAYGPEKWSLLAAATAVVYPTWEEPFGRVPFEALAAGAPVIVPERSGAAEYLTPLYPACTYDDASADALAALLTAAARPSAPLAAQVRAGQAWVLSRLAWAEVIREVLAVYAELTPAGAAPEAAA